VVRRNDGGQIHRKHDPGSRRDFYYLMSYRKSDPASRNVHRWSVTPASVDRAYHKIWGWVKSSAPTATSWGRGKAWGIVEITKGKLTYQLGGSLPLNDFCKTNGAARYPI
jgi:hypothetical protein